MVSPLDAFAGEVDGRALLLRVLLGHGTQLRWLKGRGVAAVVLAYRSPECVADRRLRTDAAAHAQHHGQIPESSNSPKPFTVKLEYMQACRCTRAHQPHRVQKPSSGKLNTWKDDAMSYIFRGGW